MDTTVWRNGQATDEAEQAVRRQVVSLATVETVAAWLLTVATRVLASKDADAAVCANTGDPIDPAAI